MSKEYQWFIEPWGDKLTHTNEVISNLPYVTLHGVDILIGVLGDDGEFHNVWRLPETEIRSLWNERKELNISFRVYNRIGSHAKIRDVTILFK